MEKRTGLGRGLGSLIPAKGKWENYKLLNINKIFVNKNQPRKIFSEESMENLKKSIRSKGVLQPIIVRPVGEKYEIVAGERRFKAVKELKYADIPAVIKETNSSESFEIALIENIQRENLNPVEEAKAYSSLLKSGLTHAEISEKVAKSRSYITNSIRLLNLPAKVIQMIQDKKLSVGHAKALLSLNDEKLIRKLSLDIAEYNLSVREIEDKIQKLSVKPKQKQRSSKKQKDPDITALEQELSSELQTDVEIKMKKNKSGSIILKFQDINDFNRLHGKIIK